MIKKLVSPFVKILVKELDKRQRKHLANKLGINFNDRFTKEFLNTIQTFSCFSSKVNALIDIGTHKGVFAQGVSESLSLKKAFCFEPNSEFHEEIKKRLATTELNLYSYALGEFNGEADFFLHKDSTMSSIVESNKEVLKRDFPYDSPEGIISLKVKVNTLDRVMESHLNSNNSFFLKIDTQGNELNILKEGKKTLSQTGLVLIEHMFIDAYKTNYSFKELINFMSDEGFECKGALSISRRKSGLISAVDFLFVKIHE